MNGGQRLRAESASCETSCMHNTHTYTANTIHSHNAGLMLGQCLRQWANLKPALDQCLVFLDENNRAMPVPLILKECLLNITGTKDLARN